MKVILLERVNKLGKIGDVVTVKGGYARNFLIPTNKALVANEENTKIFNATRAEIDTKNQHKKVAASDQKAKIDGIDVILIRQAGEDGKLFGSVNSRDIAQGIKNITGVELEKSLIVLNNPIKYISVNTIEVALHAEVSAFITVNVSRSESEAKEALKSSKEEDAKSAE